MIKRTGAELTIDLLERQGITPTCTSRGARSWWKPGPTRSAACTRTTSFWLPSVITSYSIHYTKLYEILSDARTGGGAEPATCFEQPRRTSSSTCCGCLSCWAARTLLQDSIAG